MRNKNVRLEEILAEELKNDEFRLAFEEHRFYLEIARLVSDLRTRTGLSQVELARKAGVSQPMIARLEKGDSKRTPTFDTIFRLLQVLGYTMSIHVQKEKRKRAA
ncbi:MAG: helix-turn-helix transcriptional regulator [Acidobacteria bacterium]|nr:helix-turn-helix transcriptional regulator [Acidobacteriota bacterium]